MTESLYCQQCGNSLSLDDAFGRRRWLCKSCNYVHFDDPKVAAGVLIGDGEVVLLTLRNHEPFKGLWSFPAGYVDRGEVVEEAAVREVREETGLEVVLDQLLGVFSRVDDPVIFIAYSGHAFGGQLRAGDEADEAAYFPLQELPQLAFPHDQDILRLWRQRYPAGIR